MMNPTAGPKKLDCHCEGAAIRLWVPCAAAAYLELKAISSGDVLIGHRKCNTAHLHKAGKRASEHPKGLLMQEAKGLGAQSLQGQAWSDCAHQRATLGCKTSTLTSL